MKYHVPVLLNESVNGLSIKPEGTYIDLTFGGGGHSKLILEKLNLNGKLFSFDTDDTAIKENSLANNNFHLIKSNFKFFDLHIKERGVSKVDGILADLGVSSHQIDMKNQTHIRRTPYQSILLLRYESLIGYLKNLKWNLMEFLVHGSSLKKRSPCREEPFPKVDL